jgi:hypothetical protein
VELHLLSPMSSWCALRQVHLHRTRRTTTVSLPACYSFQILSHMNPINTRSLLPSGLTKKIRRESLRLCYEGQLENMFSVHIFWVIYFRSNKNHSDLTVMGFSYLSTWYSQWRYLSYPGTSFSILFYSMI